MIDKFFKYPTTPHLICLGDCGVRSDKVFTSVERERFLRHRVVVEEKIDGANVGFSFSKCGDLQVQNRGGYIQSPFIGQWRKLSDWLSIHFDALFGVLLDRFVLFGEWCFARHTVCYTKLPDWFVAFDIYDMQNNRFLETGRRDDMLCEMGLHVVPRLGEGVFELDKLLDLMGISCFSDAPAEGIYLRIQDENWLVERAKVVRPGFIQAIEDHWSRKQIVQNKVVIAHNAGHAKKAIRSS